MSKSRKNLCKVSPELKQRLDGQRDGQSWPEFMRNIASLLETGVIVKTERYGNGTRETRVGLGDTYEVSSDLMAVTVAVGDTSYDCDECDNTDLSIQEVLITDNGDRVVCSECIGVEDRIHS